MDVPIVGQTVFVVCRNGHVVEAPQHPFISSNENGEVVQVIICAKCQFDFFASAFAAVLLPRTTTRREAEWRAKEMRETQEAAIAKQVRFMNGDPEPSSEKAS